MKNLLTLLSLLLIMQWISCSSINKLIAKKTGEFIEPQKEDPSSIIDYCKERNVDYDQLFILSSAAQFESFTKTYKHIPGIFVFDKNRYLVTTAETTNCPWTMINFIYDTTLKKKTITNTETFDDIMSHFTIIDDKSNNKNADYYILCVWAKFSPKMTKALFETINRQKQENQLNVCHILLDVDLQKSWENQ